MIIISDIEGFSFSTPLLTVSSRGTRNHIVTTICRLQFSAFNLIHCSKPCNPTNCICIRQHHVILQVGSCIRFLSSQHGWCSRRTPRGGREMQESGSHMWTGRLERRSATAEEGSLLLLVTTMYLVNSIFISKPWTKKNPSTNLSHLSMGAGNYSYLKLDDQNLTIVCSICIHCYYNYFALLIVISNNKYEMELNWFEVNLRKGSALWQTYMHFF